jgi:hypothetical protein
MSAAEAAERKRLAHLAAAAAGAHSSGGGSGAHLAPGLLQGQAWAQPGAEGVSFAVQSEEVRRQLQGRSEGT